MRNKNKARLRRAMRMRAKARELGVNRLTVYRSNKHVYAQIVSPCGSTVLAAASTQIKDLIGDLKDGGTVEAAKRVGNRIAKIALDKGIDSVSFDRAGYKYHGRVKALAEAAREAGLKF